MPRWGMVVDLEKCIGCDTCTAVCQQMNHVPGGTFWHQVPDFYAPDISYTKELHLPIHCMHCEDAPCLDVCPTTATFRRENGIIDIHDDLCIGCAYCIVACPYIARTIASYDHNYVFPAAPSENNWRGMPTADRQGICTKCDFCLPRVEKGLANGLTPGVDFDATPGCVSFCLADALHFGDLSDSESNVSQMIRLKLTARLQERQQTGSAIHYVVPEEMKNYTDEFEVVKPRKQDVWKWPAVANFVCGGTGAGLYVLGVLFSQSGILVSSLFELAAPALVLLGLSLLALEAGRPLRARFLHKHARRSWMSREAIAAGAFVCFAAAGFFLSLPGLKIAAAVIASFFILSQGFIVYRSVGIGSWNSKVMPFLFLGSGFASGFALLTLFVRDFGNGRFLSGIGITLLTMSLITWLAYLFIPQPDSERAMRVLRKPKRIALSVGIGHLLPAGLFLIAATITSEPSQLFAPVIFAAGFCTIIGNIIMKWQIIITGGYFRAIKLGRPQVENQPQTPPAFIPLTTLNP